MLAQRHNKTRKRKEWALVSIKKPGKILKWFGTKKPSKAAVQSQERRVKRMSGRGK